MTIKYWCGTTGYEFPNDPPYAEVAYTPSHMALCRDNLYGVFIDSATGRLYRVDLGVGEAAPSAVSVDGTNVYLGLVGSTSDYVYALRNNGVVYRITVSSGAVTSQIGTATSPAKLLYINGAFAVIDTGGNLWYDDGGSFVEWATHTWISVGYHYSGGYIGVGTDGKAYTIDALGGTKTQIGSATDWVDVDYNGYAAKSSGVVYDDMAGTPTAIGGTYGSITSFRNAYCSPEVHYFVAADGKMYYNSGGTMAQFGTRSNVQQAISRIATIGAVALGVLSVLEDAVYDTTTAADSGTPSRVTSGSASASGASSSAALKILSVTMALSDSAASTQSVVSDVVQWFYESVVAADAAASNSATSVAVADSAHAQSVLVRLFEQLVSEQASGVATAYLSTASIIAEVSVAMGVCGSTLVANAALAEVIVALDMADKGLLGQIGESGVAAATVVNQVAAVQRVLDSAAAVNATANYIVAFRSVAEVATGTDALTLWQSLTQLVAEGADVFVRLNISGEVVTGWVLNTQNNAASEYQGLAFNSLCKLGTRYFGATESGIYEMTGTKDAGLDIATYIQTGLMDFGSSLEKSVPYAYLGCDAEGRVALGVSVSEKASVRQYWYEITSDNEAVNNLKVPIGKGLKGRYWKFEIASDALQSFDAVTLLPAVLSRRV